MFLNDFSKLIKVVPNSFPLNQGVAKLPFIDERKLLGATRKLEGTLTV